MNIEDSLRDTRKAFFAYRNGIIADTLRRNCDPHKMIMGCQLTDVITIARTLEPSAELAQAFWNDTKHRECRMIATMLYPIDEFTIETALTWCDSVENCEIADVLCHRLLRKTDYAYELFKQLVGNEKAMIQYTAFRLLQHLVMMEKVEKTENLKVIVESHLTTSSAQLKPVLNSILEEF